jgi:NADH:ubiquinone oxidoreductase subunit H
VYFSSSPFPVLPQSVLLMAGYSSNKYSLLPGGLRATAAQIVGYEIPLHWLY